MNDRLDKRDGDGSVGELNTANVAKVSRCCLVRGLFGVAGCVVKGCWEGDGLHVENTGYKVS